MEGRLILIASCAAILVLGAQAAPGISNAKIRCPEDVNLTKCKKISIGKSIQFSTQSDGPRYGVVDRVASITHGGRSKRWATFGSCVWAAKHVSYNVVKYSKSLSKGVIDCELPKAFEIWSQPVGINFTMVSPSEKADMAIEFVRGNRNDGYKFTDADDLAYTFTPECGGDIHFNDEAVWNRSKFYHTAVHEIGHALGLGHTEVNGSAMSMLYPDYVVDHLSKDDIEGIEFRYGKNTADRESVFCTDLSIDTVFTSPDGNIYAFKGEHYWRVTKDGRADGSPRLISSKWKELPGDIDAAFTHNRKTFFFKGSTYWTYVRDRMVRYQTDISARFPGIPNDIDAATVWTGDGDIYFFKGSKYWRYQLRRRTHVSSAYPRPITDWRGLPSRLDAAVSFDGSTYFFEGQKIYEFDDERFSVDSRSPQILSPEFLGCQNG